MIIRWRADEKGGVPVVERCKERARTEEARQAASKGSMRGAHQSGRGRSTEREGGERRVVYR